MLMNEVCICFGYGILLSQTLLKSHELFQVIGLKIYVDDILCVHTAQRILAMSRGLYNHPTTDFTETSM
jgi:hypothetical protein